MMSGYLDARTCGRRPTRRQYRVERSGAGWCVSINGCATRSLGARSEAERLARRLQREADGLAHGGGRA